MPSRGAGSPRSGTGERDLLSPLRVKAVPSGHPAPHTTATVIVAAQRCTIRKERRGSEAQSPRTRRAPSSYAKPAIAAVKQAAKHLESTFLLSNTPNSQYVFFPLNQSTKGQFSRLDIKGRHNKATVYFKT